MSAVVNEAEDDDQNEKSIWQHLFDNAKKLPVAWVATADALFRSFEMLSEQALSDERGRFEKQVGDSDPAYIGAVAMMLGGFAIENLLKAIALNNNSAVKLDHNLLKYSTGIDGITVEDKVFLCRLERFTTWIGRYPIPNKWEIIQPENPRITGVPKFTWTECKKDFDAIRSLFERLRSKLVVSKRAGE